MLRKIPKAMRYFFCNQGIDFEVKREKEKSKRKR